jgi:hypothetical protein
MSMNSMNVSSQPEEQAHAHAVLRRDLLMVCGLALALFAALAILWFVDQATGALSSIAAAL